MANTSNTMTTREFYEAIIATTSNEEIKEFATTALAKLDASNEKRRNTETEKQKANKALATKVLDFIKAQPDKSAIASEIAEGLDITTAKASALARSLVENGLATATDFKVKGKGTVKKYKAID